MTITKWCIVAGIISAIFIISAAPLSAGRIEAEKLFVEAQKKLSNGDDTGAERLLKQSLNNDPDFTSAIWQLAQIYESRGKLKYARELLLRGLEQSPDASWARDKLKRLERILIQKLNAEAEELMSRGEYTAALPRLSLYHGIKPYDPTPLINLARCHLALGHPETATNYLKQGMERDPGNAEIALLMKSAQKSIREASLAEDKKRAEKLVANYTESNREEVKNALEALLSREPGNSWAREKLEELNLLASGGTGNDAEKSNEDGSEGDGTAATFFEWIPAIPLKAVALALFALSIIILAISLKKKGSGRNYPLQGSMNLIPILDIVSLINSNLKTGWLEVSGERGTGKIFFKRGEIIHAAYKADYGNEAFHAIMNVKKGRYTFYNHLPKVKQTVSDPLSILLLSLKSRNENQKSGSNERESMPV